MEKKFLELVAEILELEVDEISLETTYDECEKWDSLMMLNLVMEIEQEYSVLIPMEKVSSINKLGDFYEYVRK